jgi:hypothetical protein
MNNNPLGEADPQVQQEVIRLCLRIIQSFRDRTLSLMPSGFFGERPVARVMVRHVTKTGQEKRLNADDDIFVKRFLSDSTCIQQRMNGISFYSSDSPDHDV